MDDSIEELHYDQRSSKPMGPRLDFVDAENFTDLSSTGKISTSNSIDSHRFLKLNKTLQNNQYQNMHKNKLAKDAFKQAKAELVLPSRNN